MKLLTILTRGPVAHDGLLFTFVSLFLLASPLFAQSPCADCLKAAEDGLRTCLDNAFSAEDRVACEERRRARMAACETGECKIERDERATRESRIESQQPNRPGLTPYTPTKIEWLALVVNAQLRVQPSSDRLFSISIVEADYVTLAIIVRHQTTANREIMTRGIATARGLIMSTAKRYGWDSWVKIQERVELSPSKK